MEISIIIPVYNRAKAIRRTLDSVLRQTYRPLQVVLVDNGSTDGTLDVLQRFAEGYTQPGFNVLVAQEPKPGASAARNKGFSQATGLWVAFFDSDDVMHPTLMSTYANAIINFKSQYDVINVPARRFDAGSSAPRTLPHFHDDLIARHLLHCILPTQAYAVRRSYFASCGLWNEDLPCWNDWEVGLRLLLGGARVCVLDGPPLVDIIDSGTQSITGTGFSSKHGQWEKAFAAMRRSLNASSVSGKLRYKRLLCYRKLVLAAQYKRERHDGFARPLYTAAMRQLASSYRPWYWKAFMRPALQFLYKRIARGKRGSARIAHLIIR